MHHLYSLNTMYFEWYIQSHIKISITESDKDTDGSPKDVTTPPVKLI